MPRGVKEFTYEQFKEHAKAAQHNGHHVNNGWRWVVLGTREEQPPKPHEVNLTAKELRAALKAGHSEFPNMSDGQWAVFADIAQKLLDA